MDVCVCVYDSASSWLLPIFNCFFNLKFKLIKHFKGIDHSGNHVLTIIIIRPSLKIVCLQLPTMVLKVWVGRFFFFFFFFVTWKYAVYILKE